MVTWLIVIRGKDQGRRFKLSSGLSYKVGRDKDNAIRLIDEEVSRKHATIAVDSETITIDDHGSSNGTFVNGENVSTAHLNRGDHIEIGQTSFLVSVSSDDKNTPETVSTESDRDSYYQSNEDSVAKDINSAQWISSVKSDLRFMYGATIATHQACAVGEMLEQILDLIFEWIEVDRGCVLLWEESSRKYKTRAKRYQTAKAERLELKVSKSILKYVSDRREGVITSGAPKEGDLAASKSIFKSGIREAICVPIIGRSRILGFIYVDALGTPGDDLRFNNDQLKLMVAIGHQVAVTIENEEYYSAMIESERLTAVGQTMVTLSHHIKNILQSINGGTHLIEAGLDSNNVDIIEKGWGIVRRNQRNMSNLVMDMVSFSRDSEPHLRWSNLNQSIQVAVNGIKKCSDKPNLQIEFVPNPDVNKVMIDKALIERAIGNVLSHSFEEFGNKSQGRIDISIRRDSENVTVTVKDNFQELSDLRMNGLFKPFIHEGENDVHGIGLAVAKKILQEHHGDIKVSRRADCGLKFFLSLPVSQPDSEHPTGTFNVADLRKDA